MRRLVGEFSTFISKARLRKLLGEGSGQVIIEKIGGEDDGRQVVMRFTVHRRASNAVELSVKEYAWDSASASPASERSEDARATAGAGLPAALSPQATSQRQP